MASHRITGLHSGEWTFKKEDPVVLYGTVDSLGNVTWCDIRVLKDGIEDHFNTDKEPEAHQILQEHDRKCGGCWDPQKPGQDFRAG